MDVHVTVELTASPVLLDALLRLAGARANQPAPPVRPDAPTLTAAAGSRLQPTQPVLPESPAATSTPAALPAPPASSSSARTRDDWVTDERIATLTEMSAGGKHYKPITKALNALPGPACDVGTIKRYARRHNIRRALSPKAAAHIAALRAKLPRANGGGTGLSQARAEPARTDPIEASAEAIRQWCAGRNIPIDPRKLDIDVVNRRCQQLGHPGFVLRQPQRKHAA